MDRKSQGFSEAPVAMPLFSLSLIAVLGVVSGKHDLLLSPDGEKKFVVVEAGELESLKEQSHGDNIADEGRKGIRGKTILYG